MPQRLQHITYLLRERMPVCLSLAIMCHTLEEQDNKRQPSQRAGAGNGARPMISRMSVQVRVGPVVEDGQVVNRIWTHTDVTERAQEERLLELRNRALNYMSDGIFICDRQGSVLYTNQGFARLTGYEQRDAVGQPWTFLAVGSGPT